MVAPADKDKVGETEFRRSKECFNSHRRGSKRHGCQCSRVCRHVVGRFSGCFCFGDRGSEASSRAHGHRATGLGRERKRE